MAFAQAASSDIQASSSSSTGAPCAAKMTGILMGASTHLLISQSSDLG